MQNPSVNSWTPCWLASMKSSTKSWLQYLMNRNWNCWLLDCLMSILMICRRVNFGIIVIILCLFFSDNKFFSMLRLHSYFIFLSVRWRHDICLFFWYVSYMCSIRRAVEFIDGPNRIHNLWSRKNVERVLLHDVHELSIVISSWLACPILYSTHWCESCALNWMRCSILLLEI